MTNATSSPDVARLDELAAVTREYARYSHTNSGIAFAACGAWHVAVFVAAMRSETWGRIAALWGPLIGTGLLAFGRRYYQRHGRVLEAEVPPLSYERHPWLFAGFLGACAIAIVNTAANVPRWSDGASSPAYVALLGAIATLPAVAVLAHRLGSGPMVPVFVDFPGSTMLMVVVLTRSASGWVAAKIIMGFFAVVGCVALVAGVQQHLAYRRLERRLAALKGAGR